MVLYDSFTCNNTIKHSRIILNSINYTSILVKFASPNQFHNFALCSLPSPPTKIWQWGTELNYNFLANKKYAVLRRCNKSLHKTWKFSNDEIPFLTSISVERIKLHNSGDFITKSIITSQTRVLLLHGLILKLHQRKHQAITQKYIFSTCISFHFLPFICISLFIVCLETDFNSNFCHIPYN